MNRSRLILLVITAALAGYAGPRVLPAVFHSASGNWELTVLVVQTIIFAASAFFAYALFISTRRTAARKNTLDLIFKEHTDKDVLFSRRLYVKVRDEDGVDPHLFADYADQDACLSNPTVRAFLLASARSRTADSSLATLTDPGIANDLLRRVLIDEWLRYSSAIQAVLNRYESFAIGIKAGAIDEAMYRSWWRGTLLRDHHALTRYIEKLRASAPGAARAYEQFVDLAKSWRDKQ